MALTQNRLSSEAYYLSLNVAAEAGTIEKYSHLDASISIIASPLKNKNAQSILSRRVIHHIKRARSYITKNVANECHY